MNTLLSIALALLAGAVGAALGYLLARRRAAAEACALREELGHLRTDVKVAEAQGDQARARAEDLKEERDRALRSQHEHETATAGLRTRLEVAERERNELKGAAGQRERLLEEHRTELATLRTERSELEKRQAAVDAAQRELEKVREEQARLQSEQVKATVSEMLTTSQEKLAETANKSLGATTRDVTDKLRELDVHLREFEGRRTSTETRLDEQIKNLAAENARSRTQTEALVKALRKPQVRGQWGELQLKRAVELANMREHVDFDLQETVVDDDGHTLRPDMVVNLTSGRRVVVDAKVSLDAFLNALAADDDAEYGRFMDEHAAQIRRHVDALAAKEYFVTVAGSPDFVLMFLPNESLLQAALDRRADLYEYALGKRIIIATPTVLVPMLRTIALSWDEKTMRENTERVHELGRQIYDRLAKVGEHLGRLRSSLDGSVKHYNQVIASLEGRVLPTARRFPELGVRSERDLSELTPVERQPRTLTAPELVRSAETGPEVAAAGEAESA
ncbi:DNA recombination protein RmuC [Nocardiopsis sp. CNT312]|uniref:DNA recombination protein RmuC n=1 Tax=Nocardiopsis sp. CNT312 TaxID=1137268 RepID=UPI0006881B97|nr:DNA recombination protein RmuC [Nocardiopsis sp. CNT312]